MIFEDWAQEYQKAQINIRQNLVWEDNNLKVRNQYNLLVSPDEIIQFDGSRVILEIIDIPAVQQAKHEINIKKQEAIIINFHPINFPTFQSSNLPIFHDIIEL